jgi:hypothetical protein
MGLSSASFLRASHRTWNTQRLISAEACIPLQARLRMGWREMAGSYEAAATLRPGGKGPRPGAAYVASITRLRSEGRSIREIASELVVSLGVVYGSPRGRSFDQEDDL